MRRTSYTTWSIAAAVCLLFSGVATADEVNFSIGFTGVQSLAASGGGIRYVDQQISSNESQSDAKAYTIWTTLAVKNQDGGNVCTHGVELSAKVRPAIRPIRFQVFYPNPTDIKRAPVLALRKTKYTLYGKIEVREAGTSKLIEMDQHQFTFEFPQGGTPSCKRLMAGYPPEQ